MSSCRKEIVNDFSKKVIVQDARPTDDNRAGRRRFRWLVDIPQMVGWYGRMLGENRKNSYGGFGCRTVVGQYIQHGNEQLPNGSFLNRAKYNNNWNGWYSILRCFVCGFLLQRSFYIPDYQLFVKWLTKLFRKHPRNRQMEIRKGMTWQRKESRQHSCL